MVFYEISIKGTSWVLRVDQVGWFLEPIYTISILGNYFFLK